MVDVSKLTPSQEQQNTVMLIQHYHELCNINYPSSMFTSPPSIPNIESFSQSTISSLDSGSFSRKKADINIQQQTTLEVSDIDTLMGYNEDLDPPPPRGVSNVFPAEDLSSDSSSDSAKYKCAWLKAKVIHSYIYLLSNFQTHAVDHYPLH